MLETINLYKTYTSDGADYEVLKNVNLRIADGECVAIIGKSGSGKSTLMHLLACLDAPTSGSVLLDGADVSQLPEKERDALRNQKFGFVFQQFFLNGRDTVLENVVLPMRIRGATQYRMIKDAMDALEAVGLKDKEDKRAKDLSGGEKQRVCIARALASEPKLIFADEPTGNLDSVTEKEIMQLLTGLNKEGRTIIMVTHETSVAQRARRQIIMKDGLIAGDGMLITEDGK